jgi:hypothetical protein
MRLFPRPPGFFHGAWECSIIERRVVVGKPFSFYDGREWWHVPAGFPHDGASFPFWLRWIPAFVAVVMMYLSQLDGFVTIAELWRSILWPAVMQALIGYPLDEIVREAAGIHDHGYYAGKRPKWRCDRAFFLAIWQRTWLDLDSGRIGLARSWVRMGQACVWTLVVFGFGFFAWWGHRLRERGQA